MIDMVQQIWRKKYTTAMIMLAVGIVHSFVNSWSAGEFTTFCGVILAVFGAADLIDKDKFK